MKRELYPRRVPVLELTHNHGTEADAAFRHATGNEDGRRGFGHLGFLVPDVYDTTAALQARGTDFSKLPDAGAMKGLAFARDPVRQRGMMTWHCAAALRPRRLTAR